MRWLGPLIFSTVTVGVLCLLSAVLLRVLSPQWWKIKAVRWTVYLMPVVAGVSMVLWTTGFRTQNGFLMRFGSTATAVCMVVMLGTIVALPFSGVFNLVNRWLEKRASAKPAVEKGKLMTTRRRFLQGAALSFPVVSVVMGKMGIARAFQGTRVYARTMRFKDLPAGLEGLRILHLTDSHLGILRFLPDLEALLEKAKKLKPDLILWTGDIADDLDLLPEALNKAAALKPPLGVYASLGNHEYSRGIFQVLRIFDQSPVQLFRGQGVTLDRGGSRLYLAGADDPRKMRGDHSPFLRSTVRQAMADRPDGVFSVLMTHRPEGFDPAARMGVDLTLAGHTHGGQVGLNGRSFWATFMPGRYLWGAYGNGRSRMYLSSGIGHWFPFRLGCPPEAPVIELRST